MEEKNIAETSKISSNYCQKCGAKLEPGLKFCQKCGQKVSSPLNTQSNQPKKRGCFMNATRSCLGVIGLFFLIGLIAPLSMKNANQSSSNPTDTPNQQPNTESTDQPKKNTASPSQRAATPVPNTSNPNQESAPVSEPAPEPTAPNVAGDWSGSWTAETGACQGYSGTWTADVSQSGSSISGSFTGTLGGVYDVSGPLSGSIDTGKNIEWNVSGDGGGGVSFTGSVSDSSTNGTFSADCPLDGGTATGSFSGSK